MPVSENPAVAPVIDLGDGRARVILVEDGDWRSDPAAQLVGSGIAAEGAAWTARCAVLRDGEPVAAFVVRGHEILAAANLACGRLLRGQVADVVVPRQLVASRVGGALLLHERAPGGALHPCCWPDAWPADPTDEWLAGRGVWVGS